MVNYGISNTNVLYVDFLYLNNSHRLSSSFCNKRDPFPFQLTHWGRVTHICVSKLTIIGSDNGLSPGRRQAIIWTNAGILLYTPWVKLQWNNWNSCIFIKKCIWKCRLENRVQFVSASMCNRSRPQDAYMRHQTKSVFTSYKQNSRTVLARAHILCSAQFQR